MPQLAHKIRLDPTKEQVAYFVKACGTARYAYNWALAKQIANYTNGNKYIGKYDLRNAWNAHRKAELPWTYEVTKWAGQFPVESGLHEAYQRFFKTKGKFPRFRKKGTSKDSFHVGMDNGESFKTDGTMLKLPHVGKVRMHEQLRFAGRAMSVTISRDCDQWYASISVRIPDAFFDYKQKCQDTEDKVVGIDVGFLTLATLSDGVVEENPRWYRKGQKKIVRLSKSLSRKKKGSNSRNKAKMKLAKAHRRLRRKRAAAHHAFTAKVVKNYKTICIETLNLKGMAKTKLAKSVYDAGIGEIFRQLEYKAALAGCTIIKADKWFPSSKLCSNCSHKLDDLPLSSRSWVCPACAAVHDRDLNAARNLEQFARKYREKQNAGGEDVSLSSNTQQTSKSLTSVGSQVGNQNIHWE